MTENDGDKKPAKGRRGPKPSGKPRSQIEQESAKRRRERLGREGRVELKTFISSATRDQLTALKATMNKASAGEVIDALVAQLAQLAQPGAAAGGARTTEEKS